MATYYINNSHNDAPLGVAPRELMTGAPAPALSEYNPWRQSTVPPTLLAPGQQPLIVPLMQPRYRVLPDMTPAQDAIAKREGA